MMKNYLRVKEVKDYFSKATRDQREGTGRVKPHPLLSSLADAYLIETFIRIFGK